MVSARKTTRPRRHVSSSGDGTNCHGRTREPSPPTTKALVEQIQAHMAKLASPFQDPFLNPFSKDVAALSALLRQLNQVGGPRSTMEFGLGSLIEVTTLLLLRLQANLEYEMNMACEIDSHDQHKGRRLRLPEEAQRLLPSLDAVGNLYMKLADVYGKYRHVMVMEECGRGNGTDSNENFNLHRSRGAGKRRSGSVASHPRKNGGRSRSTRTIRLDPSEAVQSRNDTLRVAVPRV